MACVWKFLIDDPAADVDQRRLACTIRTQQGEFFSGADRRLDFLDAGEAEGMAPISFLALLVGEIHFPQIELPLDPAPRLVL
jgi:hypothetical protein